MVVGAQIIHFKWLNSMACESYLIKDVKISYMFSNWQNLYCPLKPSCKGVWEMYFSSFQPHPYKKAQ